MIKTWLKEQIRENQPYTFRIVDVDELMLPTDDIKNYLGEQTLISYRILDDLKRDYSSQPEPKLVEYLNSMVFPSMPDTFNVRQGDFGEILGRLFVENFTELTVPCYKLRWKFNNDKSTFCTDILAHNKETDITDLKYYEVKTKIADTEGLGIIAHQSLKSDQNKTSNEFVADFIKRIYQFKAQTHKEEGNAEAADKYWAIAEKYNQIILNPQNYNRSFELILIVEKSKYNEAMLSNLNSLPPTLSPLNVTIFLIQDFQTLVATSYEKANEMCIDFVYKS